MLLRLNRIIAVITIVIGVAALVETAALGGGQVGFLLGVVLVALGVMRLRAFGRRA